MQINQDEGIELKAEKDGAEIKEEHVNFSFDSFNKEVSEIEVGDTIYTKPETGVFAIMEVTKIENTYEALQEEVKTQLKNQRAEQFLDTELQEFYQEVEVDLEVEKE
jgi:hypothetical protein